MTALRRRRKTDGRMSLGDHLHQLRRRFVVAALAIAAGSVLGWVEYDRLFEAMMAPIRRFAAEHQGLVNINFGSITHPFRPGTGESAASRRRRGHPARRVDRRGWRGSSRMLTGAQGEALSGHEPGTDRPVRSRPARNRRLRRAGRPARTHRRTYRHRQAPPDPASGSRRGSGRHRRWRCQVGVFARSTVTSRASHVTTWARATCAGSRADPSMGCS
jgi:hypothetical protein